MTKENIDAKAVVYEGNIIKAIPVIIADGRQIAGGKEVFEEISNTLERGNPGEIHAWAEDTFGLGDLCISFEDKIKIVPNSTLLAGIRGIGYGHIPYRDEYIAIDAKAVKASVEEGGMKYFKLKRKVLVQNYGSSNLESNVVFVEYGKSGESTIKFTPDQFRVIKGKEIKLKYMIQKDELNLDDILDKNEEKVIHPLFAVWPENVIVPVVKTLLKPTESDNSKERIGVGDFRENNSNYAKGGILNFSGAPNYIILYPEDVLTHYYGTLIGTNPKNILLYELPRRQLFDIKEAY